MMLHHRHRLSKDIDIFLGDPQWLGYFNPDISDLAEEVCLDSIATSGFVKLYLEGGEIDFIVAGSVSACPTHQESILARDMHVETTTEIVGKKLLYRSDAFTARDLFDLSVALSHDPEGLAKIEGIEKSSKIALRTIQGSLHRLREDFGQIQTLDWSPTFDECLCSCTKWLKSMSQNMSARATPQHPFDLSR
jgi:hypothetical protein